MDVGNFFTELFGWLRASLTHLFAGWLVTATLLLAHHHLAFLGMQEWVGAHKPWVLIPFLAFSFLIVTEACGAGVARLKGMYKLHHLAGDQEIFMQRFVAAGHATYSPAHYEEQVIGHSLEKEGLITALVDPKHSGPDYHIKPWVLRYLHKRRHLVRLQPFPPKKK